MTNYILERTNRNSVDDSTIHARRGKFYLLAPCWMLVDRSPDCHYQPRAAVQGGRKSDSA
ncbi:hypothetical protein JCGZ_22792 [Jatropha curcas]|uniref:Uncharacterized protein n=1 Tax=Jatropha curcas TaxID=180498 RepID=A0A067LFI3_JATCU|nr:hypothetical protein JCGZ_22792 [Jatropha curcas]